MKTQVQSKLIIWMGIALALLITLVALQVIFSRQLNQAGKPTTPAITSTPQPGLEFDGWVRQADGKGVAGVSILKAYASYPGEIVATTDPTGYYQTTFYFIPGDEMVRVWAEKPGFVFTPAVYDWRHYYGHEKRQLDFTFSTP